MAFDKKQILITGANGFLGSNLVCYLKQFSWLEISTFTRKDNKSSLEKLVMQSDVIFHFAGVNRSDNHRKFFDVNVDLTRRIVEAMLLNENDPHLVFTSSIKAGDEGPYGQSKQQACQLLDSARKQHGISFTSIQLPNLFGKWAKPNYNSFVATICAGLANKKKIKLYEQDRPIDLLYVDDFVAFCTDLIGSEARGSLGINMLRDLLPIYSITPRDLVAKLNHLSSTRESLESPNVTEDFERKMYATFLSYLTPIQFSYPVRSHYDSRGKFSELMTDLSGGQLGAVSIAPMGRRGGHYHHSKVEKFFVVFGTVVFEFEHVITGERYQLKVQETDDRIVESIPGWAHSIQNIIDDHSHLLVWASETFDRTKPDTYVFKELV